MTYAIRRVKTCDGTKITSGGEVDKNDVYFHYNFACLDRNSLMISFPYDAEHGTYEITVNADKLGSKIIDAGNNPVAKETFSTTYGCGETIEGTQASKAPTTSARSELGSPRTVSSSSGVQAGKENPYFAKGGDSSTVFYLKVYGLAATVIALYALFSSNERRSLFYGSPFSLFRNKDESSYLVSKSEVLERKRATTLRECALVEVSCVHLVAVVSRRVFVKNNHFFENHVWKIKIKMRYFPMQNSENKTSRTFSVTSNRPTTREQLPNASRKSSATSSVLT